MARADDLATAQRLHPATLIQRFLTSLPALIFLLFFQSADGAGRWVSVGTALAYALIALPFVLLQYLRFRYWVTPREIVIQRGVFNRRKRSIPIERIQNIAVEQSLLPRMLGVAKVTIETAGSTSTEGTLEYVSLSTAHTLRKVVRSYQRRQAAAPGSAPPAEAPGTTVEEEGEETERAELLHAMPLKRVMLSGLFRFSLVYIAVIFSIQELFYPDPEAIIRWFTRGPLKPMLDIATASPFLVGLSTILIAGFLAWITGIAINLNHYYNFRLWLEENEKLYKRRGLLTVSERTIPLKKVQTLIIRSNPLMRFFGWYRLELQTMGLDVREQGHQVVAPFAQLPDIVALSRHIRPFTLPDHFTSVSRLTIRRTFIRYSLVLAAGTGAAAYYWSPALWALAALPLLGGLAYLQYRYHGYAVKEGLLFVRRGVFRQHLWVIPVERFHVLYTNASPFQRRLDLKSLQVDTAGAAPMSYPEIVDLEAAAADRLLDDLYRRFQHCFAPGASS